jgi:hypothetical protein
MNDETFRPIIHGQADLEDVWRTLMEPLGFSDRSLWLMFIDTDDRPMPQLTQIEELPLVLGEVELLGLQQLLAHFSDTGLRPAFLLSRPGAGGLTADDRRCAAQVLDTCRAANIGVEVMHVATDTVLAPVPMDDLPLPASA